MPSTQNETILSTLNVAAVIDYLIGRNRTRYMTRYVQRCLSIASCRLSSSSRPSSWQREIAKKEKKIVDIQHK